MSRLVLASPWCPRQFKYQKTHIVCRRLDPAAPELDLSLAWARGGESPAINALLEMAFQVVGRPKSRVSGESRANSHPGGPGLSELAPHSRLGNTGRARTNGAYQPGATSSLLRAPQLTRDGVGKSVRTAQARDVRIVSQASSRRTTVERCPGCCWGPRPLSCRCRRGARRSRARSSRLHWSRAPARQR